MAAKLAIDFGTSNTVLALWDEQAGGVETFHLPGYGVSGLYGLKGISAVPSLIHYAADGSRRIGDQIVSEEMRCSRQTFRGMKNYILRRNPGRIAVGGAEISHGDAGRDFLTAVISASVKELFLEGQEIVFTIPVESYEDYLEWLSSAARAAGVANYRFIDEAAAAALGYGEAAAPGEFYLLIDFGGGTLDVAAVLIENDGEAARGRQCRVLGKAGDSLGGLSIDGWLFGEFLSRNDLQQEDEIVGRLSRTILDRCESAKIRLSFFENTEIVVEDPVSGRTLKAEFDRGDIEDLLDGHDAFARIDSAIRKALSGALERGYGDEKLKAALLVGGSAAIPSVRRQIARIFGKDRLRMGRPMDAVARGAALFAGGAELYDHIQHDYAVRFLDAARADYSYLTIVRKGMLYPTKVPLARKIVKATYNGQTRLGLAIFEIGDRSRISAGEVELVFDNGGGARLSRSAVQDDQGKSRYWVNEENPTFLTAEPPAAAGEARFEVEFGIDGCKRLVVSARDLATGRLLLQSHPVARLN